MKFWKGNKQNKENKETIASSLSDGDIYKFRLNSYSEVVYVAKLLSKKKKVFVDLQDLEKLKRRRVLDFLSGFIFAHSGKVKKIKDHHYYFTLDENDEHYSQ